MFLRLAIMDEEEVYNTINKLASRLPKRRDGTIDYTDSKIAPVVVVFLKHKDRLLLLKRSYEVSNYKGMWSTVAGYLDQKERPIKEKALEEAKEELGVGESLVREVVVGEPYMFQDKDLGRKWLRCTVLLELKKKPEIKLDWEHTAYIWVTPKELKHIETTPGLYDDAMKVVK